MKSYKNGNYIVYQTGEGDMIKRACRFGEDLVADFPDSIDLKISNRCSWGCTFCHESSTPQGKIFDLEKTMEILSQLPKVPIEIAIGGGNVLDSPEETLKLVNLLNEEGYRTRVTVNIKDLNTCSEESKKIIKSVGGVGVSLDSLPVLYDDNPFGPSLRKTFVNLLDEKLDESFWISEYRLQTYVAHIIAGVFPSSQLEELFESADMPILILGYKQWGRAKNTELPEDIKEFERIVKRNIYKQRLRNTNNLSKGRTIGFDNLALEQLDIKSSLTDYEWNSLYMGDEGSHSMYIDAVNGEYARTSRSKDRVSWDSIGLLDYFRSL